MTWITKKHKPTIRLHRVYWIGGKRSEVWVCLIDSVWHWAEGWGKTPQAAFEDWKRQMEAGK